VLWWLRPALENLLSALTYGTRSVSPLAGVAIVFAIAGLVGVALAPSGQVRRLLGVIVGMLIVFFLLFRNDAVGVQNEPINYWGTAVLPIIYACVPLVFSAVPGMRRHAEPGTTGKVA
jgi:hypothetical protein